MFFTKPHIIETLTVVIAIILCVPFFLKKMKRVSFLILSLLIAWGGLFSFYIAGSLTTVKESITITALNSNNGISQGNQICVTGFMIGKEELCLSYPVSGSWIWRQEDQKVDGYYCRWDPTDEYQPPNATPYVVLEVPVGHARSISFLSSPSSGIAQVDFNGDVQVVDIYGNGQVLSVPLRDSSEQILLLYQWKQLPIFLVLFCIFTTAVFCVLIYVLGHERVTKIKRYRFLFCELVKRDFTLKYKRTILGMLWSILSPLINLLIIWFVFRQILEVNVDHFVIYIFAGQLVFAFFSDATSQGMTSLVDNSHIFTKINVPKFLFLLSKNVSSLINYGLTLLIFFAFAALEGLPFTPKFFLLVYPIFFQIILNIGLGLILSAMFVFFRDMAYLWGLFTQLIMWLSAVFYSIKSFSSDIQKLFLLNPVYLLIRYFRKIVIESAVPTIWFHLLIAGYSVIILAIGIWIYKKYNREFLYYV